MLTLRAIRRRVALLHHRIISTGHVEKGPNPLALLPEIGELRLQSVDEAGLKVGPVRDVEPLSAPSLHDRTPLDTRAWRDLGTARCDGLNDSQ